MMQAPRSSSNGYVGLLERWLNQRLARLLALSLLVAAPTVSMPAAMAASAKVGGPCTKLGAKYKPTSLVCSKKGNKLVWRKLISKQSALPPVESIPPSKTFVEPHAVESGFEITWSNIAARVNDISAAAWTDAQATIRRNQGLIGANTPLTTYLSPGAIKIDANLMEAETALRKTFALFAKFPAAKRVFFVALTPSERVETEAHLLSIYSDAGFINRAIDEMYGVSTNLPKGSVFTVPECNGNGAGRNSFLYDTDARAAAVILGVCPDIYSKNLHFEGVQGMAHEYVHTIQFAFKPGTSLGVDLIPCWMSEGEPEWAQTAVAPNFIAYLQGQHFHPYLLTRSGLNYQQTQARTWTSDEVSNYFKNSSIPYSCAETNQYAYAYSLGAAATEALVSIGGSESFFALHQRLVARENLNTAFKSVYGITWDEALPILAQVVAIKISKAWGADALTYQTRPST